MALDELLQPKFASPVYLLSFLVVTSRAWRSGRGLPGELGPGGGNVFGQR